MGMRGPRVKFAGTTLTQGRKRRLGGCSEPGRHGLPWKAQLEQEQMCAYMAE